MLSLHRGRLLIIYSLRRSQLVRDIEGPVTLLLYGKFSTQEPYVYPSMDFIEDHGLIPVPTRASRGHGVTDAFMRIVRRALSRAGGNAVVASEALYSRLRTC